MTCTKPISISGRGGKMFSETLRKMRTKSGKSKYRLAQDSGIDESYILRLERGDRTRPSRDVVVTLGLALMQVSGGVDIGDIDTLLLSAEFAPLRRMR